MHIVLRDYYWLGLYEAIVNLLKYCSFRGYKYLIFVYILIIGVHFKMYNHKLVNIPMVGLPAQNLLFFVTLPRKVSRTLNLSLCPLHLSMILKVNTLFLILLVPSYKLIKQSLNTFSH